MAGRFPGRQQAGGEPLTCRFRNPAVRMGDGTHFAGESNLTEDDDTRLHRYVAITGGDLAKRIGHPDILMLPIGGYFTIDGGEARQVVAQLKPHIVIPMQFKVPGLAGDDLPISTESAFLETDQHVPWETVRRLNSPMLMVDPDHLPEKTEVDVLRVATLHS